MDHNVAFVVYDTEGTGFSGLNIYSKNSRIIQFAFAPLFNYESQQTVNWYVNPQMSIHPLSTYIHNISNEMVSECKTFDHIWKQFEQLHANFDRVYMFAHNSESYDKIMIEKELYYYKLKMDPKFVFLDTLVLCRRLFQFNSYSLGKIYKRISGCEIENAHNAIGDVFALKLVIENSLQRLGNNLDELIRLSVPTQPKLLTDIKGIKWNRATRIYEKTGKSTIEEVRNHFKDYSPEVFYWWLVSNLEVNDPSHAIGIVRCILNLSVAEVCDSLPTQNDVDSYLNNTKNRCKYVSGLSIVSNRGYFFNSKNKF